MLTDDDLIRELEAGFRDDTEGLTYAGTVPTPRRAVVPWTAIPIAAATAAVIVLPQLGGGSAPTATPAPPRSTQTVPTQVDGSFGRPRHGAGGAGPRQHVKLVTASFEFAGRTFHYQQPADEPQRYVICRLGGVQPPVDATPVQNPYDIEKAWSGTDQETGDPAVWVQDSRYFHNQYVEMSSPSFTEQELVTMLQTPPSQQKAF
jgi:hypothetical protein